MTTRTAYVRLAVGRRLEIAWRLRCLNKRLRALLRQRERNEHLVDGDLDVAPAP
jgi:hypothetical protein